MASLHVRSHVGLQLQAAQCRAFHARALGTARDKGYFGCGGSVVGLKASALPIGGESQERTAPRRPADAVKDPDRRLGPWLEVRPALAFLIPYWCSRCSRQQQMNCRAPASLYSRQGQRSHDQGSRTDKR